MRALARSAPGFRKKSRTIGNDHGGTIHRQTSAVLVFHLLLHESQRSSTGGGGHGTIFCGDATIGAPNGAHSGVQGADREDSGFGTIHKTAHRTRGIAGPQLSYFKPPQTSAVEDSRVPLSTRNAFSEGLVPSICRGKDSQHQLWLANNSCRGSPPVVNSPTLRTRRLNGTTISSTPGSFLEYSAPTGTSGGTSGLAVRGKTAWT